MLPHSRQLRNPKLPSASLLSSLEINRMEDRSIWEMEAKLWCGGAEVYETLIDDDVVMALQHSQVLPPIEKHRE